MKEHLWRTLNVMKSDRRSFLYVFMALLVASVWFTACSSPGTSPTSSRTFGDLAPSGASVYKAKCAGCHGAFGEGGMGPALYTGTANLAKFGSAKALLDFIATAMPWDAPGSLTQEEYQQILAHILVRSSLVTEATRFDNPGLESVVLKPSGQ
jgi:cytochrome c